MADLAERVDDLICSFDSSADKTMDTLSMLIFGWMLLGLVILCVGKFIYNRVHQRKKTGLNHHQHQANNNPSATTATSTTINASVISGTGVATAAAVSSSATGLHRSVGTSSSTTAVNSSKDTSAGGGALSALHAIGENVAVLGVGASASGVAAAVARSRSVNAARSHAGKHFFFVNFRR